MANLYGLTKRKYLSRKCYAFGKVRSVCLRNGVDMNQKKILEAINIFIEFEYPEQVKFETKSDAVDWLMGKFISGEIKKTVRKIKTGKIPETDVKNLAYSDFLKTKYWASVRKTIKKRDGMKCVKCGSVKILNVHHTTYIHHGEEHLYLDDMVTLCRICHKKEHGIVNTKNIKKKKTIKRKKSLSSWGKGYVDPNIIRKH